MDRIGGNTTETCRAGKSRAESHVVGRASRVKGAVWAEARKWGEQGMDGDGKLVWWESKVMGGRVMGDKTGGTGSPGLRRAFSA